MRFFFSSLVVSSVISSTLAVHPQILARHVREHAQGIVSRHAARRIMTESSYNQCSCAKDFETLLGPGIHSDMEALVDLVGQSVVDSLIEAVVEEECAFPPNSHHVCTTGDPCAYECNAPYTPIAGGCACMSPYSMCNGICGHFPNGCHRMKRSFKPKTQDAVPCLNESSSKENCGGCAVPDLPSPDGEVMPGVDCSSIPNATDVVCRAGKCVVNACVPGLYPSFDRQGCTHSSLAARDLDAGISADLTAAASLSADLAPIVGGAVNAVFSLLSGTLPALDANTVLSSLVGAIGSATTSLLVTSDLSNLLSASQSITHLTTLLSATVAACQDCPVLADASVDLVLSGMDRLMAWCKAQLPGYVQPLFIILQPLLNRAATTYLSALDSSFLSLAASASIDIPASVGASLGAVVDIVGQLQASAAPIVSATSSVAALLDPVVLATIDLLSPTVNTTFADGLAALNTAVTATTGLKTGLDAHVPLAVHLATLSALTSSISDDSGVSVASGVTLGVDVGVQPLLPGSLNLTSASPSPHGSTPDAFDTLVSLSLRHLVH